MTAVKLAALAAIVVLLGPLALIAAAFLPLLDFSALEATP